MQQPPSTQWWTTFVMAMLGMIGGSLIAQSAEPDAEALRFFETKIRPLFVEHCYECHGADKQESDLRLDRTAGIVGGGASGPALVPGKPDQSLLFVAVDYRNEDLQMPPAGKLPDSAIADLRRWIELGAVLPEMNNTPQPRRGEIDLEQARQFWAFQPIRAPSLPEVQDTQWVRTPLDFFILAPLETNGLHPAAPADKRTLIRRVTLDLLGIPPTPEEVMAFLADDSPAAYARVVDRLLSSAQYGERWGRHWLDVVRYADSNGLDENIAHGNAWRYRDYVVSAWNADKPFDEFVVEQIAGDLLPTTDDEAVQHERLVATGFLALGPKVLAEGDEVKMEMDIIDEQLDTLGRALLGMTFGCARCHNHKFDPISTQDYYSLAGIFKSTRTMESLKRIARWNENSIASRAELAAKAQFDEQLAARKTAIQQVVDRANAELKAQLGAGAALPSDAEAKYPATVQAELKKLRDELGAFEKQAPQLSTAMGVAEGTPTTLRVHIRGSHLSLGDETQRGVPAVLAWDGQPAITDKQSGRLELAHWLVRPEQPLTARVLVNRVWRWHFGRGLVASTDNFGELGERPVNPPLLDWLAAYFIRSGWSMKELHRTILLSSTYQMSTAENPGAMRVDPDNLWQWRANVQRLDAESIRDSLLAVSGKLDYAMGGSLLHVGNREFLFDHTSKDGTKYDSLRRSIYLPVIRNHLFDAFSLFDYSDASVPTGDRVSSTIAPQALFLMNSELVEQAARGLAGKLDKFSADPIARVSHLYQLAYGREPIAAEIGRSLQFVEAVAAQQPADSSTAATQVGWEALCHVVLASSEFIYLR